MSGFQAVSLRFVVLVTALGAEGLIALYACPSLAQAVTTISLSKSDSTTSNQ